MKKIILLLVLLYGFDMMSQSTKIIPEKGKPIKNGKPISKPNPSKKVTPVGNLVTPIENQTPNEIKINNRLIEIKENFEIDFSEVRDGAIKQKIAFEAGNYVIEVTNEYPYGVVTLKTINSESIVLFNAFSSKTYWRGERCAGRGFRCGVIIPDSKTKTRFEPVLKNNVVTAIKFIALDESLFEVWEDPKNPNKGCTNPRNPFDHYGKLHNDKLDQIINSKEFVELKNSYQQNGEKAVTEYLKKLGNENSSTELINTILNSQKATRINELSNYFKVTPVVNEYLKNLKEIIQLVVKDNAVTEEEYQLFRVKEDVILKSKMDRKSKNNILTIYATARYSLYYWNEYQRGKKDTIIITGNPQSIKKIDWDEVAGVDAVCGLAGPEAAATGSIADIIKQLAEEEE